ncbi:YecA family protein [Bhargavaea cecembensis]|uniref:YecA family protein n=1 Tax=Bhargavaea cecembensis TaxID=394098 RepID=UPI0005913D4E|nr:SEC-C metal-binding domain-containing protein [Bhargavaea cecembensis]
MNEQDLMDYITAAVGFYGVVPQKKVAELYSKQVGELSYPELREFVAREKAGLRERGVCLEGTLFVHRQIHEGGKTDEYTGAAHGKRYFVPEKEELLRYSDESYVEETEQAAALKTYAKEELGYDDGRVNELFQAVKEASRKIGVAGEIDLMGVLSEDRFRADEEQDHQQLRQMAAIMLNHMRSWAHRGHTGAELGEGVLARGRLPELDPRSEEIADYIAAATHLYGVVPAGKVAEIYNEQNGADLRAADLMDMLEDPGFAEWIDRKFVFVKGREFVDEVIEEEGELDYYRARANGKPYYVPPKEELLRYANANYYEETPQVAAFRKYAKRHFFPGDEAGLENWVDTAHFYITAEPAPTKAMSALLEDAGAIPSEQQLMEIFPLYVEMSNNTRIWENRGHTPNELAGAGPVNRFAGSRMPSFEAPPVHPVTVQKIGRNDPCPCGSGKKYKKCCGKAQ